VPTFRADDGVEIWYDVAAADRPDADHLSPPVLLHHGFGASSEIDWVAPGTTAALAAAGRRVVRWDARGHGRSSKPHDPARYGLLRLSDDVRLLLDLLEVPRIDLAGYSMGGVVALLTAARDPRVRRLVVGGIGAGAVEQGGLDHRALAPGMLREALLAEDPATVTDPVAAAFRAFADSVGSDRTALAALASTLHDDRLPLDAVTVPTLVLAGRADPLATGPEVLASALPDAGLLLLDGDHGGVLQLPAFAGAIVSFLAEGL